MMSAINGSGIPLDGVNNEVLAMFLADTPAKIDELKHAYQIGNCDAVRRLAHYLKGSAMYVSALRMCSFCEQIEALAKAADQPALGETLAQLEQEFSFIVSQLKQEQVTAVTDAALTISQRDAIKIVVADDHPVLRLGVRQILKADPALILAGEAKDGKEAVDLVHRLKPDVLLLDLAMPELPGLEVMRELTSSQNPTRVLLLTAAVDKQVLVTALQLGARGIVLKDAAATDIVQAIHVVMAGQYWLERSAVTDLLQVLHKLLADAKQPDPKPMYNLTSRELQVVAAIVEGCTNRDVAQKFSISEETVKRHVTNIFDKVGVSSRLELALFAINHQLIPTS